jgi:hypothetical protein
VGYIALFFAMSAGAYAAGLAPDSVKSKHIRDGQIQNADLGADSVAGAAVQNRSLSGADLAIDSVGTEVVRENELSEVPRATIAGHGGYGRQSGGPEQGTACDPTDDLFITCASVALTPSAPARFFVTGRFMVSPSGSNADDYGIVECRLGSSAFGGIPGTSATVIVKNDRNLQEFVALTGITDPYQPGNYSFGIDCRETDGGAKISAARVTAVAISPF